MASFKRLCEGVAEEPLRIEGPGGSLHAMSYRPLGDAPGPAIVFAPPDGEERDWALRPLVTASRTLAARGCAVLRFDYFGQGESDGNYEDASMATRIGDLRAVIRAAREKTGRVPIVVGVRLGGAIAALASAEEAAVRQLVLWEPVLDTDQYLQQMLRVNVSTQMVQHGRVLKERPELIAEARNGQPVSVNGYRLSGTFIDALLELNVIAAIEKFEGRILAVTTGLLNPRVAAFPHVKGVRVQATPLWKEPKAHTIAPTPFLGPTVEWLVEAAPQLCEVR
jgi:pimeloyl-ACP methyl ester carboxylesterase